VIHLYATLTVAKWFPPDLSLDASEYWHLFSIMDATAQASK